MKQNIKGILFDFGRTLYDNENECLFPESLRILAHCKARYRLGLVSIVGDKDVPGRITKIEALGIRSYFDVVHLGCDGKDILFANAVQGLGFAAREIVVVDDRMQRLHWPIAHGCTVIWLRRGKFALELPDSQTGFPTYTIHELKELFDLL